MQSFGQRFFKGDPWIWGVAFGLSMLSILVVYSATGSLAYRRMGGNTEYYLIKHSLLTFMGVACIWLTHRINYRYYFTFSKIALWISLPLLAFTIQFGTQLNEATRWLHIPFVNQSFQPADFARFALLIHVAGLLAKHQRDPQALKATITPVLFWSAGICGLIALSDVSSAVLTAAIVWLMLFVGRIPIRYLMMLFFVMVFTGGAAVLAGQRGNTAVARVTRFIENKAPYQLEQAYVAISSGGLLGKGPGKSDQRNFLPHAYSDFIYAIILEEYGMIGGLFVLGMYVLLLYRGSKVLLGSKRVFGGLLSTSLCIAIVAQAMSNMAVAVGLLPVTGLPLPFVSMGGTSQLFMGMSLGVVLSVSRQDVSLMAGEVSEEGEDEVSHSVLGEVDDASDGEVDSDEASADGGTKEEDE